jgi:hypothetical protein
MKNISETTVNMARIAQLLRDGNEHAWAATMDRYREQLPQDIPEARYHIMRLFGGMGSISDVVLYREGHLLTPKTTNFISCCRALRRLQGCTQYLRSAHYRQHVTVLWRKTLSY